MKKLLLILLSLCLLLMLVSCGETVSVTGASVDENGDLIVTFSDGTTQNAGKVKGEKGDKGDKGDTGDSAATDVENPLGLDFYPLPDGTWMVAAGKSIYLEEVTIPATYKGKAVTCIGALENIDVDFFGASWVNIKRITIPDGVTSIGICAFYSCSSLASVTIPSSVTSIGKLAFDSCSNLSNIYFGGTEAQWNAIEGSSQINSSIVTYNYTA